MTKYFFEVESEFNYNRRKFPAGIYFTENVEFVQNSQHFIKLLKEEPEVATDFDSMTEIPVNVEVDNVSVDISDISDIKVEETFLPEEEEDDLSDLDEIINETQEVFEREIFAHEESEEKSDIPVLDEDL